MTQYLISTDQVIIGHIAKMAPGTAVLHACVGNEVLKHRIGVVTKCDTAKRMVVLQMPDGSKEPFSFDHITVPAI